MMRERKRHDSEWNSEWEAAHSQGQGVRKRGEQQVIFGAFFSFPVAQSLVTEHLPGTKGERRAVDRTPV